MIYVESARHKHKIEEFMPKSLHTHGKLLSLLNCKLRRDKVYYESINGNPKKEIRNQFSIDFKLMNLS